MSGVIETRTYPAVMDHKLRRIRSRQTALAVVRAVMLGAFALGVSMIVAMAIDGWFTLFDTGIRIGLTVAAVFVAVVTLLRTGVGPVAASLGLQRAAHDADRELPQLEERWTTIASFAESNNQPHDATGRAMLQHVTSEAVALGSLVEPRRVVHTRELRTALLMLAGCLVVLGGFLSINWRQNRVLLERFWAPGANIAATQLKSDTGDIMVPRGDSVEITVAQSGLQRESALLTLVTRTGINETIELEPQPESAGAFAYRVAAVEHSFKYRVRAGDGQTQWHSVTVIDRPTLAEVRLTLTAPSYVDRPRYEKSYLPDRVRAIQGSRLTLEMRPGIALERLELLLTREVESDDVDSLETDVDVETLVVTVADDGWYRFEAILEENFSLSPVLFGPHDLTNEDRPECSIRVIPDKAPVARVISPTDEMSVDPDEVIEIKFEAHDDHGIAMAELIIYEGANTEDGEAPEILSVQQIPLGNQELQKHVTATALLDLSEFNFIDGTNISYAVRVTDNRTGLADPRASAPGSTTVELGESTEGAESKQSTGSGTPGDASRSPVSSDAEETGVAANEDPDTETSGDKDSDAATGEGTPADTESAESPAGGGVEDAEPETATNAGASGASTAKPGEPSEADKNASTGNPDVEGTPSSESPAVDGQPTDGEAEAEATADSVPVTDNDADAAASAKPSDEPGNAPSATGDTEPSDAATDSDDKTTPVAGSESAAGQSLSDDAETPDDAETSDGAPQEGAGESNENSAPPEPTAPATTTKDEDGAVVAASQASKPMPRSSGSSMSRRTTTSGQNTVSNRLRLKVAGRKPSGGGGGGTNRKKADQKDTSKWLEQLDAELEAAELVLQTIDTELIESSASETHVKQMAGVDKRLSNVERLIGNIRKATKETRFAFAGLQLVQLGRSYVTPARDRVFVMMRQPDADFRANVSEALQRVSRARELLAGLLKRIEKIEREEKLAEELKKAEKIYTVYIKNVQRLMREARQNGGNPLKREMAIVEVDQAYLDRLREVLEMRGEMMAEFGRILADDPRLLVKYMDIIRRRRSSLRADLKELAEQQADLAEELAGWRSAGNDRRDDVWLLAAELRLYEAAPIATAASQLEERTIAQMPLTLDTTYGTPKRIADHAKQIAVQARAVASKARRRIRRPFDDDSDLVTDLGQLAFHIAEYAAALDELEFQTDDDDTGEFVLNRQAENRARAERVIAWAETAEGIQGRKYHALARVDQEKIAQRTEVLQRQMLNIQDQLDDQFVEDVPEAILAVVSELQQLMEDITFNQTAATYSLDETQLEAAEAQQSMAVEGFARAEELFDQMRRMVIEELDKIDPDDPDIMALNDPTLDEFLQRLEREPNLNALLGIPNRPRNLKVMSEWMQWNQKNGGGDDGEGAKGQMQASVKQAMKRAAAEKQKAQREQKMAKEDRDPTEEEWKEVASAQEAQEKLDEKIKELNEKAEAPDTDEAEAEDLRKMAKQLERLRDELAGGDISEKEWKEMARSDQMKAVMRAMASGAPFPDTQWNTLLSSLDKGLWQVKRRIPPEDHRTAIEQYQEQIRRLMNLGADDDE